jgi:peptide/nickel transport system substrate-binding protein
VILWGIIIVLAILGVIGQIRSLNDRSTVAIARNGGVLREAAVGTVKNLNPILPENSISADMNRLVFSGLTQHNNKRQVVPDLASSWDISTDGKTYTFHLRHNIVWHDGVPFGAPDVVFTLAAIQNPDSRSPLSSSWQGVKAEAKGDDTVIFTLPNPLSSFLDATTVGILPRHILESVDPNSLRENGFNQNPIGTGPFKIKAFATAANEISFEANPKYYGGKPKLDGYRFDLYATREEAVNAYASRRVDSLGIITPDIIKTASSLKALASYDYKLPEEVNLFFRTDDATLKDTDLRRILSASVDRKKIIQAADNGIGLAISQPLLPGQPGYTTAFALAQQNTSATRSALTAAGWEAKGNDPRLKDGKRLKFSLVTLQGGEL